MRATEREPSAGPAVDGYRSLLSTSLPCCLVTSGSIVSANAAFGRIAPDPIGLELAGVFRLDRAGPPSSLDGARGSYSLDGCDVPVLLTVMEQPESAGTAMVVVQDGRPFRDAEDARFGLLPYGVVRLSRGGSISYANDVARDLLGMRVAGRDDAEFALLFDEGSRPRVRAAVARAAGGDPNETLSAGARPFGSQALRVTISPDLGPGGIVLGAVAVVRSVEIEAARDRIRKVVVTPGSWRERLDAMLEVVSDLVPFDLATFGIYGEGCTLFRAAHVAPATALPWPHRWMRLPPGMMEWVSGTDTTSPDLDEYAEEFPGLKDNEVFLQHRRGGVRSFMTLPVIGPQGPSCSLTLSSRSPHTFGQASLQTLRELDLVSHLVQFERELLEEPASYVRAIGRSIRAVGKLSEAADVFTSRLRNHLHWDHAGLYVVDGQARCFRLVAQASATDHGGLGFGRTHAWDEGILGEVRALNEDRSRADRRPVTVDDLEAPGARAAPEVPDGMRSATGYPIAVAGEWFWILIVSSNSANAFHDQDAEALNQLVPALEAELDRVYRDELNQLLLDLSPEGVVVASAGGRIASANRTAAERLLGYASPMTPVGEPLERFGGNRDALDVLNGRAPDTSRRIQLLGRDGKRRPVLATRHRLSRDFDSSVWFFSDLENLEWNVEFRYLREIVSDVAQQTRGPLMLASTLLRRVAGRSEAVSRDPVGRAIEQTIAEVEKADITFERLAEELSASKEPMRQSEAFHLEKCVAAVVAALPDRDRNNIELALPDDDCVIEGDLARLRFAIRSMLGHLLRVRPAVDGHSTKVRVELERIAEALRLTLSVTGLTSVAYEEPPAPKDAIAAGVSAAREESGLGLATVEKIVSAHGGALVKSRLLSSLVSEPPVWAGFALTLPTRRTP